MPPLPLLTKGEIYLGVSFQTGFQSESNKLERYLFLIFFFLDTLIKAVNQFFQVFAHDKDYLWIVVPGFIIGFNHFLSPLP